MAINFPNNPVLFQTHSHNGRLYSWDGSKWTLDPLTFKGFTGSRGLTGPTGGIGFTGSQGLVGSTGFVGSRGPSATYELSFSLPGALSVGTGVMRWYITRPTVIVSVSATVSTAPTGASIIFDVNKNGTSIFTSNPSIAQNAFTSFNNIPTTTLLAVNDYLTVDVDQIGSIIGGSDAVIRLLVEE